MPRSSSKKTAKSSSSSIGARAVARFRPVPALKPIKLTPISKAFHPLVPDVKPIMEILTGEK